MIDEAANKKPSTDSERDPLLEEIRHHYWTQMRNMQLTAPERDLLEKICHFHQNAAEEVRTALCKFHVGLASEAPYWGSVLGMEDSLYRLHWELSHMIARILEGAGSLADLRVLRHRAMQIMSEDDVDEAIAAWPRDRIAEIRTPRGEFREVHNEETDNG